MKMRIFVVLSLLSLNSFGQVGSRHATPVPLPVPGPLDPPERLLVAIRHGLRDDDRFMQAFQRWFQNQEQPFEFRDQVPDLFQQYLNTYVAAEEQQLIHQMRRQFIERNGTPWYDPDLAESDPQTELHSTASGLLTQNLTPDVIITSPNRRAIQSAQIIRAEIVRRTGNPVQILVDFRLQEWAYAAYGRYNEEIVEITREQVQLGENMELLEHDLSIEQLRLENTGDPASESRYYNRIAGVMEEHSRNYQRLYIVGHLHTVGAAILEYPFANVISGGYALLTSSGEQRLNFKPEQSRGIKFHNETEPGAAQ